MTKNQLRLLTFAINYPCGWHTCGSDALRSMYALQRKGFIDVIRYEKAKPQFRLALPRHIKANIDVL